MDMKWFFEQFGTVGLVLAGVLYDRVRLLADIKQLRADKDALQEKLIQQSQDTVEASIRRELETLNKLGQISEAVARLRTGDAV